jgi:hypothetical protein
MGACPRSDTQLPRAVSSRGLIKGMFGPCLTVPHLHRYIIQTGTFKIQTVRLKGKLFFSYSVYLTVHFS